jgi:hypothetical protein
MNWHVKFESPAGWQDDDAIFATENEAKQYAFSEANERSGVTAFQVSETDLPRNAFVTNGLFMRVRSSRA